jgi:hypothetical protein
LNSHSEPWSRRQKRLYGRLMSWCKEAQGRGADLLRVDLTTAPGGDPGQLKLHFQELRRRIERKLHYYVEYFCVQTAEGHGVLHMVWAIETPRRVYIAQKWLSQQWSEIHGAQIVWIKKLRVGNRNVKRVSQYLVSQYLANQEAIIRVSWSWRRSRLPLGKAWSYLKREFLGSKDYNSSWGFGVRTAILTKEELLDVWDQILATGSCTVGKVRYIISERRLICVPVDS